MSKSYPSSSIAVVELNLDHQKPGSQTGFVLAMAELRYARAQATLCETARFFCGSLPSQMCRCGQMFRHVPSLAIRGTSLCWPQALDELVTRGSMQLSTRARTESAHVLVAEALAEFSGAVVR